MSRDAAQVVTPVCRSRRHANFQGKSVEIVGVDVGKDAADAAHEDPLGKIDEAELTKFATDLEAEGIDPFEALRYASTMLK